MEHFIRAQPNPGQGTGRVALLSLDRDSGWHGEKEEQGKVTRVDNTESA